MQPITKAKVVNIDYATNMCTVNIPLFQNAGDASAVEIKATIIIPPGVFNGLKVNDTVFVLFEDDNIDKPVIIGKLYQGASTEAKNLGGSVYGDSLVITNEASLPISTKLTSKNTSTAVNTTANSFSSISDIITAINKLSAGSASNADSWVNQNTVMCRSLLLNLYGYTDRQYSVSLDSKNNRYIIYYNDSKVLNEAIVRNYMKYMTGYAALPPTFSKEKYYSAFMTVDSKIYYPVWDAENSLLYFVIINDESFDDHVKRLIEEYSSQIIVTDISDNKTAVVTYGTGAEATDTEDKTVTKSLKVDVVDLMEDEEEK